MIFACLTDVNHFPNALDVMCVVMKIAPDVWLQMMATCLATYGFPFRWLSVEGRQCLVFSLNNCPAVRPMEWIWGCHNKNFKLWLSLFIYFYGGIMIKMEKPLNPVLTRFIEWEIHMIYILIPWQLIYYSEKRRLEIQISCGGVLDFLIDCTFRVTCSLERFNFNEMVIIAYYKRELQKSHYS